MIIRGGENIQPTEIENYFHSHPGIEDIYVIGVPSKRLGEEVAAYISVPVISDYESTILNHQMAIKSDRFKVNSCALISIFPQTFIKPKNWQDLDIRELGVCGQMTT